MKITNSKILYNTENGMKKSELQYSNKIYELKTITTLSDKSLELVRIMYKGYGSITFGNDNISKMFKQTLNSIKRSHKDTLDSSINLLYEYFELLKKQDHNNVSFTPVRKHISSQKNAIEDFLNEKILEDNDFDEFKLQRYINIFQNTNHFVKYFYLDIEKGVDDRKIIQDMEDLLVDYHQVNGTSFYEIPGNKRPFRSSIHSVSSENIDMEKVDTLLIPFSATGSDFLNVVPELKENTKVILNLFEQTPYQLYLDMKYNREEVIDGVIKLELEYKRRIQGISSKSKKLKVSQEFFKEKKTLLNDLEKNQVYGLKTSIYFIFLSNKTFGGNIEWNEGISNISVGSDLRKYNKSVISKIEFFGYWIDKFNPIIENEDFSVVIDKYDSETTLTISDPLYVKENETELLQTRVTYGNGDFQHRLCVDYHLNLKGQFIYHNYNNSKLLELFDREDIGVREHKKTIHNGRSEKGSKQPKCVELIFFSKQNQPMVSNNTTFQPLKQVS